MRSVCTCLAGAGILGIGWLLSACDLADGAPPPLPPRYLGIRRLETPFSGKLTIRYGSKRLENVHDLGRVYINGDNYLVYVWVPPEQQRERGLLRVEMGWQPGYIGGFLPFPDHKWTYWGRIIEEGENRDSRRLHHELWPPERVLKNLTVLEQYSISANSWVLPFLLRPYTPHPEPSFRFVLSLGEDWGGLYGFAPRCCCCCKCCQQAGSDQKMAPEEQWQVLQVVGYLQSREDARLSLQIAGKFYGRSYGCSNLAELLEHHGFDFSRPITLFTLSVVALPRPEASTKHYAAKILAAYLYVVRSPQDVLLLPDNRCLRLRNIKLVKEHLLTEEMLTDEFLKHNRSSIVYFPVSWVEFEGRLIGPAEPIQVPHPGASLVRPIVLRPPEDKPAPGRR